MLARQHGGDGVVVEKPAPAKQSVKSRRAYAVAALRRLELAVRNLSQSAEIKTLLSRVVRMIEVPNTKARHRGGGGL